MRVRNGFVSSAASAFGLLAALLVGLLVGVVTGERLLAQQQAPPDAPRREVVRPADRPVSASARTDAQLAHWLMLDNQNEIALGKLARQHGKSADVQEFGRMMIEDHQKFIDQIERFARTEGPGRRPRDADATDRRSDRASDRASDRESDQAGNRERRPADDAARGARLSFVGLKRELAAQNLQSAREELEALAGAEFDKAFIAHQVVLHQQMLDTLRVFERHASDELKPILADGRKTTEQHREHARKLLGRWQVPAAETSQRPSGATK